MQDNAVEMSLEILSSFRSKKYNNRKEQKPKNTH